MAGTFRQKRPDFDSFKKLFLEEVRRVTGKEIEDSFAVPWPEVGDTEARELILRGVSNCIRERYSVDVEPKSLWVELDAPVESVISQFFHFFSTVALVEHINAKVLEQREQIRRLYGLEGEK